MRKKKRKERQPQVKARVGKLRWCYKCGQVTWHDWEGRELCCERCGTLWKEQP